MVISGKIYGYCNNCLIDQPAFEFKNGRINPLCCEKPNIKSFLIIRPSKKSRELVDEKGNIINYATK